jgi:hypothetical protein
MGPTGVFGRLDHTLTDFGSTDKFIEDNRGLPRISGSLTNSRLN